MSWRVWTGKYQEELRHLRGLIDEIDVIIQESGYEIVIDHREHSIETRNKDLANCVNDILKAIEETQNEYEEASKDE